LANDGMQEDIHNSVDIRVIFTVSYKLDRNPATLVGGSMRCGQSESGPVLYWLLNTWHRIVSI
jgi:hypothetical protein